MGLLTTRLLPEGGLASFMPTTLFYQRRVEKQQAVLDAKWRRLQRIKKEREAKEAEAKRLERLRTQDPNAFQRELMYQQQQRYGQLVRIY